MSAMLCACNEQKDESVSRELYFYGIEYPEDSDVAIVYVTFSKTEQMLEGVQGEWHSTTYNDGTFYKVSVSTITYDQSAIFSAASALVPQEDLVHNDVEYKGLKVVLRYDTIYKSIKSDVSPTRVAGKYVHNFDVAEDEIDGGFTLTMRSARSESWYGVLIASAMGVVLVIVVIRLLSKGEKWQKKKKE